MLDVNEFAMRMREARTMMNMTLQKLAASINYSQTHVEHVAGAQYPPSLEMAMAIAEALHVDLEWLCGLQDMPRRADSIEW